MNRRKILSRVAIAAAAIVLVGYITYLLFALTDPQRFKDAINESVRSYAATIETPEPKEDRTALVEQVHSAVSEYLATNPPKDGSNGQNGKDATYEQVKRAVYEYMAENPVKDGTDGSDGTDGQSGKTPQLRCNVPKNRWEVRFGEDLTWQLLNGEKVKCTLEEQDGF